MKNRAINKFSDIKGETIFSIKGSTIDSEEMTFTFLDGSRAVLYHEQGCCESVTLAEIHGDLSDLIGYPLLLAEEVAGESVTTKVGDDDYGYDDCSHTWTFYKLATVQGHVTLRWLGESNGYYSEEVDFRFEPSSQRIANADVGVMG